MKYLEQLEQWMPEMLALLEQSVNMDSPSANKGLTDRMIDWYEERFKEDLGAEVERVPNDQYGDRLVVRVGSGPRKVLLVGHADTVWPSGETKRRPFQVDSKRAYGPGVYDMKASLIQALFAIKILQFTNRLPEKLSIMLLINSDEEIGSPTSRKWIESFARDSEAAFVLEPPMEPSGALKTARKGSGRFHLSVIGRAAHAGVNPESGVSAVEELAQQIIRLHRLSDAERGIHVNVGKISGGFGANVVADYAEAEIDVRVRTMEDFDRFVELIHGLASIHPDVRLQLTGDMNRPPMERTDSIAKLYQIAREAAMEQLNLELEETSTGGVSDGNFIAACGTPTLDGLGVRGDGAHSPSEFIWLHELPRRTALLASILERL
ncbi:M20 family metallopeptidase [Paenibacillus alvei]|uniref:M20 family metallopeptidase n=1 Tax=Paenibacillus alvei TaxID=44250 RepID=UPI0013DA570E|nr:M20 family metallopeptidase [Paenibacillus alvei]NEZ42086.1 M20/M25/M40 family metallo-hydrolase [Paenibacillus alvei]